MSQNNITTVRDAYDSFARGDFAHIQFDRNIEWMEPDVEGIWCRGMHRGSDAVIKEVFEPTSDKFDDFRLECDQYLDAGEHVVVTGRFLGHGKDTGNELNAPFAHIWRLRNGKIVSFQNYSDTANLLHALYRVLIERPVGAHG